MSTSPFLNATLPLPAPPEDRYIWAVVTQASPLRIRVDGDRTALGITPDCLAGGLTVGQRVYCQIINRRLVVLGVSGDADRSFPRLRLTSTDDLSPTSSTHAFQIGPDNGLNIGIDSNEIMARNAGANASLYLNNDGGKVYVGSDGIFSIGGVETGGLFVGEQNVTEITTQSLDSLVTTGLYIQRASANTSATRKYPINVAGFLEVFSHNGNTNFVYQRYTAYGSFVKTYIRTSYNGTWYSWRGTSGSIVYSTYVSINVSANTVSSANVSFPSGMFQSAPNVVVTANTTAPGTVQEVSASSVSASGCTVNIYRRTSTNTGVWVVAVETP